MRILQLTSDWKWTGPAEPMLGLARGLGARGHEVAVALPEPPPGAERSLAAEVHRAGLVEACRLVRARGLRPLRDRPEVTRLAAVLDAHAIEIVHTWHTRDHLLALRAAGARRRAGRTAIVRSYRRAERIPRRPWSRWLFGPGTDGLLCPSVASAAANRSLRGGRPIAGLLGATDLARFRPAAPDPELRRSLGLDPGARVVGIVARMQPERRFDLLLEAARRLLGRMPEARLLVIGRGTRRAEVAERPAARLGIADRVVFAGYRHGDYAEVLRICDLFTFLVPGSDGSCRALLEAHASGLASVTTRRGALAEIVADGETGLLVAEEPDALAAGWERLLRDDALRAAMGAAARLRAERCFDPEGLAAEVEAFYRSLRGAGGPGSADRAARG